MTILLLTLLLGFALASPKSEYQAHSSSKESNRRETKSNFFDCTHSPRQCQNSLMVCTDSSDCIIDCIHKDPDICKSALIACPANYACSITVDGPNALENADIRAYDASKLKITVVGQHNTRDALKHSQIYCPTEGHGNCQFAVVTQR